MTDTEAITPSMQDYLKAMLFLSESMDEIRVTDVASMLNIAKASVAQEIDHLKKHGLVTQKKYGPIELTADGKNIANEVRWRHSKLKQFLVEVLDVDPKIAEKDACLMEHAVSAHTMIKLMDYLEKGGHIIKAKSDSDIPKTILRRELGEQELRAVSVSEIKHVKTLDQLKTGECGKVLRITSPSPLKKRLLDMGLSTGAEIQVKGVAPMGDPLELKVKGYLLSLRKEEASQIYVEMGV